MGLGVAREVVATSQQLANVGVGFVVGAFLVFGLAMVFLFRSRFHDLKALLMLALAIGALPVGLKLAREKTELFTQARQELKVENVQLVTVAPGEVMMYFTTPTLTIAYVEYKDNETGKEKPIFPDYPITRRYGHAVLIKGVGPKGGSIGFVVEGEKVLFEGGRVEVVGVK